MEKFIFVIVVLSLACFILYRAVRLGGNCSCSGGCCKRDGCDCDKDKG